MPNNDLHIEQIFDAPIHLVWEALTKKDLMKQWFFDLEEFKPEPGFTFQFTGRGTSGKEFLHLCEIIEVIPEKKLSYTWKYDGYTGNSLVTFELFDEAGKTKLTLTHSGLATFPKEIPDFVIKNFENGWNYIVTTALKDFLESN
ncbi:SRPBCC domain-containing protein [Fulvivirgaceae bacterium BMA12]|uniref:SRPBCC domain-containing protein n=1 Tax=Agaribacillus aureus TaxID=3051825 RepID=A0ABT8L504_9BACT|nr:SRPBCC domain-containing protein [Fulvivirgaceae bacterium BMA12]